MQSYYQRCLDQLRRTDWMVLLFLVLVLNVKTPVKIAAIVLFVWMNREMLFEKEIYRQRFLWFYIGMIAIALLNLLLTIFSFTVPYLVSVSVGILFWLLCLAAAMLNSWFVKKRTIPQLHATISLFFILNALVTIGQLFLIILDSGAINPYSYQGMHQKYFISTGDLMRGISFDVSTTNAVINTFAIIYFLSRNRMWKVLLCMIVLLLSASNITNILLVLVLLFLFIFQSTRNQKSVIVVCFFLLAIFMIRVSPQNNRYMTEAYKNSMEEKKSQVSGGEKQLDLMEKPDSLLSPDEKKQKIAKLYLDSLNRIRDANELRAESLRDSTDENVSAMVPLEKIAIPKADIHSEPFQRRRDTSRFQLELLAYVQKEIPGFDTSLSHIENRKLPGKWFGHQQTLAFFKANPLKIISGNGIGNFSSKLAFRTTGLGLAGSYPKKFIYINHDFKQNHLHLYLDYFSKDIELHSLINSPDSVYDQLIAEYGLLGVLAFTLFYLAFFIRNIRRLTYGVPVLILLLGAFGIQYWFEQLSVVIIAEFLLLLNKKETGITNE